MDKLAVYIDIGLKYEAKITQQNNQIILQLEQKKKKNYDEEKGLKVLCSCNLIMS